MFEIKTELRLQLHSITDMSKYVRTIVSPYSKVATNIKFTNSGRPSERAHINFLDDNLIIILDWDYLVVATIGKTTDLDKPEERFIHFFEILKKVEELKTYNDLKFSQLKTWDLLPDMYTEFNSFEDKHLKSSKLIQKFKPNDVALTLEGYIPNNSIKYSCSYGPFNYSTDIEKHDLGLFNRNAFEFQDSPKEGCLVNVNILSNNSSFDIDSLSQFLTEKKKVIKYIQG